jgi:hypothetical protein
LQRLGRRQKALGGIKVMRHAIEFMSFAAMVLLLVVCFEIAVPARQDDGKRMTSYMTASEIVAIASGAYVDGLSTGTAFAFPVATKRTSKLEIIVLFYREPTRIGVEEVYPPHHIVAVDPTNGKVLRNEPCTPKMFGLDQAAGVPVKGFGLDPGMSAEVFWKKHDRLMEISSGVWQAYASGASHLSQQSTQLVREYYGIFNMIAKKPLMPYYRAAAPDFFKWLEEAAR